MDEHGYMHTETLCIIEDIPTDDDDDDDEEEKGYDIKIDGGRSRTSATGAVNSSLLGVQSNKKSKTGGAASSSSNGKTEPTAKKQMGLSAFFTVKKK